MAVSTSPTEGVRVVTTPGTSVTMASPADALRDNTHTIIILNNTAGTDAFARWQTGTAALTATNASVIPGGSSLTLSIGSKSQRPQGATTDKLYFDSVGVACTLQITYINGLDA